MAIEAKAVLLKNLENQLSTRIPAAEMAIVLSALSDQLAGFNVEQTEGGATSDDLLEAYTSAMQIQGRSEKTITRYRYIITQMMDHVKIPTRNITVYHLRQYLASEKNRGIADRTLEGMRQVFSAYFNWLQREHLIDNNPVANLGAVKYAKKTKVILSEVEIEKLESGTVLLRDRAIICFLLSTGCRISEMTHLNKADIDMNGLECTVLGKGNKERTVYLAPVAGMLLQQYLATRTDDNPALFIGKRRERLTPGGVRAMLTKLAAKVGIAHVHPHMFRRTLATTLIRHGMSIQEVAAILGHDKLDTTMQYVVLDKTETKNAYRKYA